jgi:hypothetical protein
MPAEIGYATTANQAAEVSRPRVAPAPTPAPATEAESPAPAADVGGTTADRGQSLNIST